MRTELYWIEGPWSGRLAIMPRPRGGDWLDDEVRGWRVAGVDIIVSLLTADEISELDLLNEMSLCRAHGIEFLSFAIVDRSVPESRQAFSELVTRLWEQLGKGKNIAVHCRQGIGRSALVGLGISLLAGLPLGAAMERVRSARGCPIPETAEQQRWIADFEKSLATHLSK